MKNFNKYIYLLFISSSLFCALQLTGCKEEDIEPYKSANSALWFERGSSPRVDTIEISATFFPGIDTYTHPFKINLIGDLLTSPQEYKVIVIDSLTDAEALKYIKIPESSTFKNGVVSDSMYVKFDFKNIPDAFRGRVTCKLVESDYFKVGFIQYSRIILWVNNVTSKPLWWDATIDAVYLGVYSAKKLEEFIRHTEIISLENVESLERQKICLDFKKYVEKNNILDVDKNGKKFPMEIPIN